MFGNQRMARYRTGIFSVIALSACITFTLPAQGQSNTVPAYTANGELLAPWAGAAIRQPALFIIGAEDPFVSNPQGKAAVERLSSTVPGLRRTVLIEDAGHWIQQERPAEVSAVLLDFLRGLPVRE